MKLKELGTIVRKEFIYECYCNIVANPKEYKKITRNKMFDEIIKTYSNIKNIQDILTYKEAKLLKKALKNNQVKANHDNLSLSLYRKMLLLPNFNTIDDILYIPEELSEYILEAIKKIDLQKIKKQSELNELVKGMIMVYGVMNITTFIEILLKYYPDKNYDELYNYLVTAKSLECIISIDNDKIENYEYLEEHIGDEILDLQKEYPTFKYKEFSKNELQNIASGKYSHPSYRKFINFLTKNLITYESNYVITNFQNCINTVCDPESFCEWLNDIFYQKDIDLDKLCDLFTEAYFNYPCAVLYGHAISDLTDYFDEEDGDNFYSYTPIQANARMCENDINLFFKVYLGLLEYANKKLRVTNLKKIYRKENLPSDKLIKIRDALFKKHRNIINDFINDNPFNFDSDELEIITNFKNGIIGEFIIIEHRQDCTIVCGKDNVNYKIKGLYSNIEDVIPAPAIAEMLILPFKNMITYDGLISAYPISMGSGMTKTIKDFGKKEALEQIKPTLLS